MPRRFVETVVEADVEGIAGDEAVGITFGKYVAEASAANGGVVRDGDITLGTYVSQAGPVNGAVFRTATLRLALLAKRLVTLWAVRMTPRLSANMLMIRSVSRLSARCI